MSNEWFGLRLKELREAAGLTQPALAEKAGLSKGGIADLEQGRREPSWATVQILCAALDVDCTAFQTPPQPREAPGPGRPAAKKPEAEEARPKRPRGRPRKGAAE